MKALERLKMVSAEMQIGTLQSKLLGLNSIVCRYRNIEAELTRKIRTLENELDQLKYSDEIR